MAKTPKKLNDYVKYSIELGYEICSRMAAGETLYQICKDDAQDKGDMPWRSTVYAWLGRYPDFRRLYLIAKDDSLCVDFDQIEEITRQVIAGEISPPAANVAIRSLQWILGRKDAKKFGNYLNIDETSSNDKVQKIEIIDVKKDKDEKDEKEE